MKQTNQRKKSNAKRPLDADAAREKCLRLLSRRARSEAELRDRLREAGCAEPVAEQVLAGLAATGLIDDEEFARAWVMSRKARGGSGRRKLSWELLRKGVSRELIERVLAEEIDDETERRQAAALARTRLRNRAGAHDMIRLRRYLLGRGYGFETVDSVLQNISQEGEH
ncbi:MAG: regulatory protein RecX [Armatimonadetes bacterium]|nr:regulatory protein RecX [Armatimonadota bacterium]